MPLRGTTCYENRVVRRAPRSRSFPPCTLCRKAALVPPFTLAATMLPLLPWRTEGAEECGLITTACSAFALTLDHAHQRSVQVNPPVSQSQSVGELLSISFERTRRRNDVPVPVILVMGGAPKGATGAARSLRVGDMAQTVEETVKFV